MVLLITGEYCWITVFTERAFCLEVRTIVYVNVVDAQTPKAASRDYIVCNIMRSIYSVGLKSFHYCLGVQLQIIEHENI
jgi:hypothetical protein